MCEAEVWRTIPGLEAYAVSNLGHVKRILPGRSNRWPAEHLLKGSTDSNGNLSVRLITGTMTVHSLVWRAFKGELARGWCIFHLNKDRADVRLSNLDCRRLGTTPRRVISKEELEEILEERRGGATWGELVRWHGISSPCLRDIIRKKEKEYVEKIR
jgi:hypothetical protein